MLAAALLGAGCTRDESPPAGVATSDDSDTNTVLLGLLAQCREGSVRSWSVRAVKIHLAVPEFTCQVWEADGSARLIDFWDVDNDYNVPMMRVDKGDKLFQVPKEAFSRMQAGATAERFLAEVAGWQETIEVARSAGVDYQAVVGGCLRRDRASMHTFFWLTSNAGFDAASAEGHAGGLGGVLCRIGDMFFGDCLAAEPEGTRRAVQEDLLHDLGWGNGATLEQLQVAFPSTLRNAR
jgi:hypothetical protein